MKLSVIIPCKNEEGNVLGLYNKLNETLKKIKYEIIFVDDGSTDDTLKNLREIYDQDMQHVKVISFSRNFKKEAAMFAGLEVAKGQYTCIVDGDLQQNPKYLWDMMEVLDKEKEYDEVAMVMKERTVDTGFMAFCKKMFYKIIDSLSDVHFESAASDFRMFRTNVKEAVLKISESNRFSKGIFAWVGFRVKYLSYDVEPRGSGKTSFGFKTSLAYAIDGIVAFSTKLLGLPIICGIMSLLAFLIYLVVLLIQVIGFGLEMNIGYVLILLALFLFGIQFILMGIMGEYIAKIHEEVKNRPIYIVKERLGFQDETIL